MKRIIMHWTAGHNVVSDLDRDHYHFIVDGHGKVVQGRYNPEANEVISGGAYAAHTRACNTGSIGVAVAAMAGAVERPFDKGSAPITGPQLSAFTDLIADLAHTYGIQVTRKTILSHAEVQTTLGIWQRGKWDISWLPGMTSPADPVVIGDRLRAEVAVKLAAIPRKRLFG
jgi:N-acetyl-anhydromuramyl-L-alanine amidase AmpD